MLEDRSAFLSTASPSMDMMQGEITSMGHKQDSLSTLDEPVVVTIKRDLRAVLQKFTHVLIPRRSSALLQQWDLWGPMILITTLAILLQTNTTKTSAGIQFAQMFLLMLIGAITVTINSQLLGGKISFFQSICVLGYCLLPLLIAALINNGLLYLPAKSSLHAIRFLVIIIAFAWTMFASVRFLDQTQHASRRLLVLYPIFLFYFLTTCLILLHTHGK